MGDRHRDTVSKEETASIDPQTYYALRDKLFKAHPRALDELAERVKNTADYPVDDAETLWRYMGDKPLFTHNGVDPGRRAELAWKRGDVFPGWQEMASDSWLISHTSQDGYRLEGKKAVLFGDENQSLISGNQAERLYAMREFALWLAQRVANGDLSETMRSLEQRFNGQLETRVLKSVINDVFSLTGRDGSRRKLRQWGPATILHGLMDAGYSAVKPDLHLVYATTRLSKLFKEKRFSRQLDIQLKKEKQKAQAEERPEATRETVEFYATKFLANDIGAIASVLNVTNKLAKEITPLSISSGKPFREIDTVLMRSSYEISRTVDWFKH